MTLRFKILLVIAATLGAAMVLLHGTVRQIVRLGFVEVERELLEGFAKIEEADTRQHVQRARDALGAEVENLSVKAADWAQWDDTYRFVQDGNEGYRRSNLQDAALSDLKLNFLAIIDATGKTVFQRWYDLDAGRARPVPESLERELRKGAPLLQHKDADDVHSGILLLPEVPFIVVSRPITRSDGKGTIRGSVVFGRMLDAPAFDRLASITHLSIQGQRTDLLLPEKLAGFVGSLRGGGIRVEALGPDRMAGYTLVHDLQGRPALLLRVDVPREIHHQGLHTQRQIRARGRLVLLSLVVSILTVGVMLAGVILWVLERSVLSRLARFSSGAVAIGRDRDFRRRLGATGKDEISKLAGSIDAMLDDLAASHRTIEVRNQQLRLIMDSVPSGLLSLDEELRIGPEHSRSAERLLEKKLDGELFLDALGLSEVRQREELRGFLELFQRDLVPEDSMLELNPLPEFRLEGGSGGRWLRLQYRLIRRGEAPAHLLVMAEDVTREKLLAERAEESEEENLYLRSLAEDPELFAEVLGEGRSILRQVEAIIAQCDPLGPNRAEAEELFRGVHTLKGAAASFSMAPVAAAASRVEDRLEAFRTEAMAPDGDPGGLASSVRALSEAFGKLAEGAARLLGEAEGEREPCVRVSAQEINLHIRAVDSAAEEVGIGKAEVLRVRDEAVSRLRRLRTLPAGKALRRSVRLVPGLAHRLKKSVELCLEGEDVRIDAELVRPLNRALLHLLRNALDHGIESAAERAEAGKPPGGRLHLRVAREGGRLSIQLADDGRGLDAEKLKRTAVGKGLLRTEEAEALSNEEVHRLVFQAGASTAERVTDVSGRGVGLHDALRTVEGELGGEILVESRPGEGTEFTLVVPCCAEDGLRPSDRSPVPREERAEP